MGLIELGNVSRRYQVGGGTVTALEGIDLTVGAGEFAVVLGPSAFGLRLRTVLRMATTEGAVIGVLGTAAGLAAGWVLLAWLVRSLLPETLPEIGIVTFLAPNTVLTAVGLGVVAVALAPLLTSRKLRSMDIPSTLRVVE